MSGIRQALVASSMACLACYRATLKSVYDMCGFCFIGFLWGEYVMMACHRLTLKSVYDMCTGQPVASRQALLAFSMA